MSSGNSLPLMTGVFIAHGTNDMVIDVGFRPKVVLLIDATGNVLGLHTDKMDADSAFILPGGTDNNDQSTSNEITLSSSGFTVSGSSSSFGTANDQVFWIALA